MTLNATEKLKFVLGWVQNIVVKGENAGYQYFLFFPQHFQKATFLESFKVGIVWQRVKAQIHIFNAFYKASHHVTINI